MLCLSLSLSLSLGQVGVVRTEKKGFRKMEGGFTRGIYMVYLQHTHTHTYTRVHTFKVCFAIVKFLIVARQLELLVVVVARNSFIYFLC